MAALFTFFSIKGEIPYVEDEAVTKLLKVEFMTETVRHASQFGISHGRVGNLAKDRVDMCASVQSHR